MIAQDKGNENNMDRKSKRTASEVIPDVVSVADTAAAVEPNDGVGAEPSDSFCIIAISESCANPTAGGSYRKTE